MIIFAYLFGFLAMFGIGADTSPPAMAAAVGSGARSMRQAIVLIAVFATIGGLLEGGKVAKTIGEGIVDPGAPLPLFVVLAILITISLNLPMESALKFLPIPTSYVTVGSLLGVGLLFSYQIKWATVTKIFLGWAISPIMAGLLAIFIYYYLTPLIDLWFRDHTRRYRVYMFMLTASSCFTAYTLGANHLGFVTGPLIAAGADPTLSTVIGLTGIISGPILLGSRFIKTIGNDITELSLASAFSAQLAAATTVELMTQFGIPVSLNEVVLASVAAIGISTSVRNMKKEVLKKAAIAWPSSLAISSSLAALLAYTLMKVL